MDRLGEQMMTRSKADVHVHTTYSDGAATPEDVLNFYALHSDMNVLAITDHDTLDGAFRAREFKEQNPDLFRDLDLIIGEEVTSRDGHILGLFLEEWIPPGMSAADTVAAIHAQGGLAIAAHPYTSWMTYLGLVGVGDLIRDVPFDAVETRNSNFTEVFANRKAHQGRGGKAAIGASDGHFLDAVGLCYTEFAGRDAADFRRAVEQKTTVPGGHCYGVPTLLRYVVDRLRTGGRILPSRDALHEAADGGDLEVRVHADSSFLGSILHLSGRLVSGNTRVLDDALRLLLESDVGVVLEMSGLEVIDSEGITVLVRALKTAAPRGLGLAIVSPSRHVLNSIRVARLDRSLDVFPDIGKAKTAIDAKGRVLLTRSGLGAASGLVTERESF